MNKTAKRCGCTHTHTHTCTFNQTWSKGGSRGQLEEVSILPRDCE